MGAAPPTSVTSMTSKSESVDLALGLGGAPPWRPWRFERAWSAARRSRAWWRRRVPGRFRPRPKSPGRWSGTSSIKSLKLAWRNGRGGRSGGLGGLVLVVLSLPDGFPLAGEIDLFGDRRPCASGAVSKRWLLNSLPLASHVVVCSAPARSGPVRGVFRLAPILSSTRCIPSCSSGPALRLVAFVAIAEVGKRWRLRRRSSGASSSACFKRRRTPRALGAGIGFQRFQLR